MRGDLAQRAGKPGPAVPRVRSDSPVPAPRRPQHALSTLAPRGLTAGAAALSAALASVVRGGEAPRIGLVGNTGSGKTTAAREIVRAWLTHSPGLAVVVDAKAERRYDDLPGAVVRESLAHYADERPPPGARLLILRPSIFDGAEADPEAAAAFCWRLAGRRWPTLLVNDELVPHAAHHGQWRRGMTALPRAFIQGRVHGLSQLWGTTALQGVPVEAADQSSVILVFQTAGLGLRILGDRNYLVGVPPGTVEGLAGFDRPPDERGEFLALRSGVPWDGRIYRV